MRANFWLGLISLFALSSLTFADGVYIPERAVPVLPSIPLQRALIVHRNGMETLVVESTFDTQSRTVGWILPLPAEPTKLEVAEPGMLTSLAMSLRPEIIHDRSDYWEIPLILLFCIAIFSANQIIGKDSKERAKGREYIFSALIIISLFYCCLLPALSTAGGHSSSNAVNVVDMKRVGNYEVAILKAPAAAALSRWLTDHSLSGLSSDAIPIADDYIARKWCFMVAKLQHTTNGPAAPHPILATFPAVNPIFPMKMTSLANTTTRVELFYVGDQQATAQGFRTVAADQFHHIPNEQHWEGERQSAYEGDQTKMIVGNPDMPPLLWPGCTITHLQADVAPQAMKQDVQLKPVKFKPVRKSAYSPSARCELTGGLLLWTACILVGMAGYLFRGRRQLSRMQARIFISAGLILIAVCLITYFFMPTIPVKAGKDLRWIKVLMQENNQGMLARELFQEGWLKVGINSITVAEFPKRIHKLSVNIEIWTNPFTGQEIRPECSPGNYMVRKIDKDIFFCTYDIDGRETHWPLTTDQPTSQSQ